MPNTCRRACSQAILDHGGAAKHPGNAFTRVLLALYGILSWNNVPVMPVEIMRLLLLLVSVPHVRRSPYLGMEGDDRPHPC